MTDAAWAWAAGIFEGEGCIVLRYIRKRQYVYPRMIVRMTDEDVVRQFHTAVGGRGAVYGPFTSKARPNNKPWWEWQVQTRSDCAVIIAMFWPWLGERRRERIHEVLAETATPLPDLRTRPSKESVLTA